MDKIYTGIGSRQTPADVLHLMTRIGHTLARLGWTLRSGHADGADKAFEYGADQQNGTKEIYLPWENFNGASGQGYITPYTQCPETYDEAERVAASFHPAWHRCSRAARALHTRNVYQVAGQNLDRKSDMVICWTPEGRRGGGTGQALRIAEYLEIPIFDLAVRSPQDIINFINHEDS